MIICPWKEIRRYVGAVAGLEEAVAAIEAMESFETGVYPLSNAGRILINAPATTRDGEGAKLEAHRDYLDVQYVFEGEEYMGWAPTDSLEVATPYSAEKDCSMHTGDCQFFHIPAGYCYIVFPEDAHAPAVHLGGKVCSERKMIIKLKV